MYNNQYSHSVQRLTLILKAYFFSNLNYFWQKHKDRKSKMFGDAVPTNIMDGQKLGQMFKVLSDKFNYTLFKYATFQQSKCTPLISVKHDVVHRVQITHK